MNNIEKDTHTHTELAVGNNIFIVI